MILVVESGSSKAEWAFLDEKKTIYAETAGINPATQMGQEFLFGGGFPHHLMPKISQTYFYGAGVKSDESKTIIQHLLTKAGTEGKFHIESDLLGAARACCQKKEGVVAILGTGSNVCLYDGKNIHQFSPSLGFILGDEGSGCHLGKEVLRAYFNKTMPSVLIKSFEKTFMPTLDETLQNTYKNKGSNAYIASFASFLGKRDHEWKHQLIKKVFLEFVEQKLLPMPDISSKNIHFVGSIAHFHSDILGDVLKSRGLHLGSVLQKPLEKLIHFHKSLHL